MLLSGKLSTLLTENVETAGQQLIENQSRIAFMNKAKLASWPPALTVSEHRKRIAGHEAELRQKSDAAENARGKELHAREREAELGHQRLSSMQA